jgi:AraC family L-rhamnose operon transcriptional activator RhaR
LRLAPHTLSVEGGHIEILAWNYAAELHDNVPHRHTFYEVCQVGAHGKGDFLVEGVPHRVSAGDVFFARPGVVHQILNRQKRGMELRWVCWSWKPTSGAQHPNEISALMQAFAASQQLVTLCDGRVKSAWDALRVAAESPWQVGSTAQVEALTLALIIAIAQSGAPLAATVEAPPSRADAGEILARAAVRYISDNLDGQLSLETIAAHVHVSPRHLSRVFEKFAGTSPGIYIERARLDRAAYLLSQSSRSIKEIAASTGYHDVHHFTRRFAAQFGIPPGRFRSAPENYVRIIQKAGDLV